MGKRLLVIFPSYSASCTYPAIDVIATEIAGNYLFP